MRRLATTLVLALAALGATAAPASAAYTLTAPAAGAVTTQNRVVTTWSGACDGAQCRSFDIVYSQSSDVDANGRLVLLTDPTKTDSFFVGDPAVGTATSFRLDPFNTPWYVQLQWRSCAADGFTCTNQQTAPSPFTVKHQIALPGVKVTNRYRFIREIAYRISFTGNAKSYSLTGIVAVQKRNAAGRLVWSPVKTERKFESGQFGRSSRLYFWKAGRVRTGTKIRVQGVIKAPGFPARVVTTFSTAP